MSNIPQFLENLNIWGKSKGNKCFSKKNGYIDEPQFKPQFNSWTRKDVSMECPYCGLPFKSKNVAQIFCSDKCRRLAHKSVY